LFVLFVLFALFDFFRFGKSEVGWQDKSEEDNKGGGTGGV
jgi:hypothetical protein